MTEYIYKNASLPIGERIADLLSLMTLEEKVRQLDQYSASDLLKPGSEPDASRLSEVCGDLGFGTIQNRNADARSNNIIQKHIVEHTRLGIPVLFSEEGLHGFFKSDCTVFPQQILLASTFEPVLAEKTGHAIAEEAAAHGVHEIWGPVLDLARDPRWGRTEEGYGEDTYLASRLAVSFVRGMQGDDVSQDDRVISEPKHFSGYGAPIGGLNCMPCAMSKHEHYMLALPIFEAAFTEGGAMNTMCSYSSIDGIPCASDYELLTGILRDQWHMPGFVRSDMCAIAMLHAGHDTANSREEAIRQAIEAGVDVQLYDFPHDFYQETLIKLVKNGALDIKVVDRAVSRVLYDKFRLGLFENPYSNESLETRIHSKKNQDIALETARKGICLLKNSDLLPLDQNIKIIAVIGPSADEAALGDYTVHPEKNEVSTVLSGIKQMVSRDTQVLYAKGCNFLDMDMTPIPAGWLMSPEGKEGLRGEYFNNPEEPDGVPALTRIDRQINFNWIYYKPDGCIDSKFSVRWTGKLVPKKTLDAYIGVSSMDSMKLWIDGKLVVNTWDQKGSGKVTAFSFKKGEEYAIKIEYKNDNRGARVVFGWSRGDNMLNEAVEAARRADVAVVSLGDSHETSGENFDRCDLNLPGKQLELLKSLHETGTPIVLVLQSGRPLSITWETDHIPAILEAWFPGEKGGQAIAEILFGKVNPSGKLPISFPKTVGQLPVNYNRKAGGGKRYIEMDWNPLIPFGFGLSYTSFGYSNLVLSSSEIKAGEELTVSFDVTNTGDMEGEEVAQLYINDCYSSVVKPAIELKGFQRIKLQPGETKTVSMKLGEYELRTLTRDYRWVVEPGEVLVMAGSSSSDIILTDRFNII